VKKRISHPEKGSQCLSTTEATTHRCGWYSFYKKNVPKKSWYSLFVPKALLDAGGTAQGNRTCPDCVGVQAYNNLPSILPVVSGSLPRRPQSSCNG